VPQLLATAAAFRAKEPVMPGERGQRQLQDDLGGSLRPTLRAPGRLEAHIVAAHLDQDAGELRADCM
jgi:hypothetical protein